MVFCHGTIGVNGEMSEIYDNCYYKYNLIEIKARPESEKGLVYEMQLSYPIKMTLLNKQQDSHIQARYLNEQNTSWYK